MAKSLALATPSLPYQSRIRHWKLSKCLLFLQPSHCQTPSLINILCNCQMRPVVTTSKRQDMRTRDTSILFGLMSRIFNRRDQNWREGRWHRCGQNYTARHSSMRILSRPNYLRVIIVTVNRNIIVYIDNSNPRRLCGGAHGSTH